MRGGERKPCASGFWALGRVRPIWRHLQIPRQEKVYPPLTPSLLNFQRPLRANTTSWPMFGLFGPEDNISQTYQESA